MGTTVYLLNFARCHEAASVLEAIPQHVVE